MFLANTAATKRAHILTRFLNPKLTELVCFRFRHLSSADKNTHQKGSLYMHHCLALVANPVLQRSSLATDIPARLGVKDCAFWVDTHSQRHQWNRNQRHPHLIFTRICVQVGTAHFRTKGCWVGSWPLCPRCATASPTNKANHESAHQQPIRKRRQQIHGHRAQAQKYQVKGRTWAKTLGVNREEKNSLQSSSIVHPSSKKGCITTARIHSSTQASHHNSAPSLCRKQGSQHNKRTQAHYQKVSRLFHPQPGFKKTLRDTDLMFNTHPHLNKENRKANARPKTNVALNQQRFTRPYIST